MFNRNEWKKEIFKEDLNKVILVGLLMALLGGILCAIIEYLFSLIYVTVSFGIIINCILIGLMVRKSYVNYHVLYPVLSILFMILAAILSRLFYPFIIYLNIANYFNYLASTNVWLYIIFGPVYRLAVKFGDADYITVIIGFIIHLAAYVICYRIAKGNN